MRFGSSRPRRGRPSPPDRQTARLTAPYPTPTHAADDPDRYSPRRRYPWHDDPDYDPAQHRLPRTDPAPADPAPADPATADPAPADPATAVGDDPGGPVIAAPAPPPGAAPPPPSGQAPDGDPEAPTRGQRAQERRAQQRAPRKLTVTRVAALRAREFGGRGVDAFRRAIAADGADRSGLTALTYPTMLHYALESAVAVALANTLFFAAATGESRTNVALYLAITVAPFAVVAPVIGPMLDRLQRGRRAALALSFAGRAVLCVVMAFNYDTWLLYPAALGVMVLSKSYMVLKAAVTPRVLPPAITLATTNSRLTTFGLVAGGVFGGVAVGVAYMWGSPGALIFTAALAVAGGLLCLRIPAWVEVTAGEVPAGLRRTSRGRSRASTRAVLVALWGAGSVRVLTGFLTLFIAFAVREQVGGDPAQQLILIGIVGASAGIGSFVGNAFGARQSFQHVEGVVLGCLSIALLAAIAPTLLPGIATAAAVGFTGATCSALAKVSLDAVVQRDLPEESRASAFGRSETVLQLAWVLGGALGVLLPHRVWWIGFGVTAAIMAVGLLQAWLLHSGHTLLPFLGPRGEAQPAR